MRQVRLAIVLGVACLCAGSNLAEAKSHDGAVSRYATLREDDDTLQASLRKFLGRAKNVNSADEGPVAEQVIEHLALPDVPFTVGLGDGFWIASGSLPHAAQTKGAVLIDPAGHVRAAALLEFVGDIDHPNRYEAWVYVANDANADAFVGRIKRWRALGPTVPIKITRLAIRRS